MTRAFLVLTLLVLLAPLAGAANEDAGWRLDPRTVALVTTPDGFTLTSTRDSPLAQDVLTGSFDATAARLDLRFTATRPESTDVPLSLTWSRLVEYRDADGDGRYGLADPEVQRIDIHLLPHNVVAAPLVQGGQTATVTYTLPEGNASSPFPGLPGTRGTLRLDFSAVQQPASISGQSIDPTEVGLVAEVRSFPYHETGTLLALVTEASSPGPLQGTADGFTRSTGTLTTQAVWPALATVDGRPVPAPVTAVNDGPDGTSLVQSWPRGSQVSQSGSIAVQRWADIEAALGHLRGDWRFYSLGLAAVVVGLGVPSWRRLREP